MAKSPSDLEALLGYLKGSRGFDFSGYKRASLERRVLKRMATVGVANFDDYLHYLQVHPEEFPELFNTILINVTSFFRDSSNWDFLRTTVVPGLLSASGDEQPIRLWSAGCASGEEAYSLAMVFAEQMGVEAFRRRVKIYATDVDEDALEKARAAVYTGRDIADVPANLVSKYFDERDGAFAVGKDLRRQVIFGRHDLIQDAPISHVDLLLCRNTLMYFNAETQGRILRRFQFALKDHGVLFLGRAETLVTHTTGFAAVDLKRRISRKLPSARSRVRNRSLAVAPPAMHGHVAPVSDSARLQEAALEALPTAHLLLDSTGALVVANQRARKLLGISPADIGRPLQDLQISHRPAELRATIDRVRTERRTVIVRDVEWSPVGDARWFDLHVFRLAEPSGGPALGTGISLVDVTTARRVQLDLDQVGEKLETAYEELQSANEELETTNEELQATVEELETTNDELHSTNEELQTMNEELQSTNAELQTMNDELRVRREELDRLNAFLNSVLASLGGAVIVVDRELRLLAWNDGAEKLWPLRSEKARGGSLLGLHIGLSTEPLKSAVRSCLDGRKTHSPVIVDAIDRRGRGFNCKVTVNPLLTQTGSIQGVILLMDEATSSAGDGQAHARSAAATSRARNRPKGRTRRDL